MSFNRIIICGHLGAAAEIRYTQGGKAVTTFSVATSHSWKGNDNTKKTETQWHRCVMWESESVSRFLTKGKQVLIEGMMKYRKYEDKDGVTRHVAEVLVQGLSLMGGGGDRDKPESDDKQPTRAARVQEPEDLQGMGITDDDVPF